MTLGNTLFSLANNIERLPQMALFAAVVREGGFGRAAAALGVSKSHVSKHVAKLEDALGVRLLNRTTRQVQLTEGGELFYEKCVELLGGVDGAIEAVRSVQNEAIGRLHVSVPVSFGRDFLQAPLLAYLKAFPKIDAVIEMSDQQVDVASSHVDLAIRVGPISDPDLVVHRLMQTRRLVVGAPSYFAEHGRPAEPSDLRHHACLLYRYQRTPTRWLFERDGKRSEVHVHGRVMANNGDFLAEAACAGLGLAWLPDFVVARHLRDGSLIAVLDSQCRETQVVNAILPARTHVPTKVRELLRYLERHLRE